MKDEAKIHEMMKQALKTESEPAEELNERIIRQIQKGSSNMQNRKTDKKRRVLPGLAFAAMVVLAMGVTCFAAVKLLSPNQVAEKMGDTELAKAFESENILNSDQAVTKNGYTVTLLGVTTGNELSDFDQAELDIQTGSTYAVVAIAKADGTSMPSSTDEEYGKTPFFISPLIKGLKPWNYNIASMNGSYGEQVINGILYRIIQCDNVEIFADQDIYLCVSDTDFYDTNAFNYEETTGEITENETYDGINILFPLPLDPAKADSKKAEEYLQQLEKQWTGTSDDDAQNMQNTITDWMEKIQAQITEGTLEENLREQEIVEGSVQTAVDEGDTYLYEFHLDSGMGGSYQFVKDQFVNGMDFTIQIQEDQNGNEMVYLILLQEEGESAKGVVYRMRK